MTYESTASPYDPECDADPSINFTKSRIQQNKLSRFIEYCGGNGPFNAIYANLCAFIVANVQIFDESNADKQGLTTDRTLKNPKKNQTATFAKLVSADCQVFHQVISCNDTAASLPVSHAPPAEVLGSQYLILLSWCLRKEMGTFYFSHGGTWCCGFHCGPYRRDLACVPVLY